MHADSSNAPRPSYLQRGPFPLNIAHRGGAGERPESTALAFQHALDQGHADIFELDVWLTRDEAVVVFHDPDLERTTNGTGLIAQRNLAEIQALDAGYTFEDPTQPGHFPYRGQGLTLMTLDEVFAMFPRQRINIDLKDNDPALVERTLEIIDTHHAHERVCIGTFHDALAPVIRDHAPNHVCLSAPPRTVAEVVYQLLCGRFAKALEARARYAVVQIPQQHSGLALVTPTLVSRYHKIGLDVHVWTINDPDTMRDLTRMGVDGIVTDVPTTLHALQQR